MPQAMGCSRNALRWQSTPNSSQTAAVARIMGVGPQQKTTGIRVSGIGCRVLSFRVCRTRSPDSRYPRYPFQVFAEGGGDEAFHAEAAIVGGDDGGEVETGEFPGRECGFAFWAGGGGRESERDEILALKRRRRRWRICFAWRGFRGRGRTSAECPTPPPTSNASVISLGIQEAVARGAGGGEISVPGPSVARKWVPPLPATRGG